jgi:hypothetical protein
MVRRLGGIVVLGLALALWPGPGARGSSVENAPLAAPLGTAFTYQGQLKQSGAPANGTFSLEFRLFDAPTGVTQLGSQSQSVAVTNGVFTVQLDFGVNAFNGEARFLEIVVNGTPLAPRQALTPSPHALALPGLYTQPNATSPNLIGGFSGNSVTAGVSGGTIGGGGQGGGGGQTNRVTDDFGTVGGGRANRAGNNAGTASDAPHATVGGGSGNAASGAQATVGGGTGNNASGAQATVPGGSGNNASGPGATVPGGTDNSAEGINSFAAGNQAYAIGDGTFVWSDNNNSPGIPFFSATSIGTGAGQFTVSPNNSFHVRAAGGARFVTSTGNDVGAFLAAGGSTWTSVSHSSLKDHFAPVDGRAVLERLAAIPIQTWNLRSEDPGIRHIGPMAEAFWGAYGLGYGDAWINQGDADGVALAAIQGLNQKLEAQEREIKALKQIVETLTKKLQ